jgi:hypothetical protein
VLSLHFLGMVEAINGFFSEALVGDLEDALLLEVVPVPLVVLELIFEFLVIRIVSILAFRNLIMLFLKAFLYLIEVENVPEGFIRDLVWILKVGCREEIGSLKNAL